MVVVGVEGLEVNAEPKRGGHRLTLEGRADTGEWQEAAMGLSQDVADDEIAGCWEPQGSLRVLGWETSGRGVVVWMVGDVSAWIAMHEAGIDIPALAHARARIPAIERIRIEHRPIASALGRRGTADRWPWPVQGCGSRVVRITGNVGEAQMRGLARCLAPAVRRHAWMRGGQPCELAEATVRGTELELPLPTDPDLVLELLAIGAQAYWTDIERVELR